MDKKDKSFLEKRFKELNKLACQRGIVYFTNFLSMEQISLAVNIMKALYANRNIHELPMKIFGGREGCERCMVAFVPDGYIMSHDVEDDDFPIKCIKITPVNVGYCEKLSHGDYLGTLMGLGIERDRIGDILIKDEILKGKEVRTAYVFCKDDISDVLKDIDRVRRTSVQSKVIDIPDIDIKQEFTDIAGSVSSLRLDSIVAVAIRTSRTGGLSYIREGSVYLNGTECKDCARNVKSGDIFTVRGHGKFLLTCGGDRSKKGRIRIVVKKYM